ncbi:MAG TPA: type VI secretion system contractile sheath large subunit, partial [Steroidobacteraceae bacterium]|nr:type VI secretion system contractile sheath large subunit [Steroidobacteraceae bacterium]
MPGRIEFDVNLGPARDRAVRPDASDRLRILVLGNLAGRRDASQRPPQSLADRAIHAVDLDNFDQVLARIAPSLVIEQQGQGGPELAVSFDELEAFHPDALYDRLDLFRRHRDLKARLKDPARFEAAAREMIESGSAVPTGDASIPDAASESVTELSERLLGGKPRTAIAPRRGLDEVIRRLVEPYVQQDPAAGSAAYLSALDAAASLIMRDLLRHPAFREIESNWRSVRLLVEELDVDHSIDLTLFDASRQELAADTAQRGESPESTQLYRKIVDGMERNPPALIVAAYEFGATPEDLHLLAHLGRIGASIGAPVIGAAAPALFGAGSLAQHPDPRDWTTISGDV